MTTETKLELEARLALKRAFLRAALAIAGGAQSSPAATKVAGHEAGALKTEIAAIEHQLSEFADAA